MVVCRESVAVLFLMFVIIFCSFLYSLFFGGFFFVVVFVVLFLLFCFCCFVFVVVVVVLGGVWFVMGRGGKIMIADFEEEDVDDCSGGVNFKLLLLV